MGENKQLSLVEGFQLVKVEGRKETVTTGPSSDLLEVQKFIVAAELRGQNFRSRTSHSLKITSKININELQREKWSLYREESQQKPPSLRIMVNIPSPRTCGHPVRPSAREGQQCRTSL